MKIQTLSQYCRNKRKWKEWRGSPSFRSSKWLLCKNAGRATESATESREAGNLSVCVKYPNFTKHMLLQMNEKKNAQKRKDNKNKAPGHKFYVP